MTTDLDPRFRRADGLSAPDLWADIERRAEGPERGPGFDRRRWLTIAVAAAIAAGAFGGLWLAFNGNGNDHPAAGLLPNGPIVFAKNVGIGPNGLALTQLWARDPVTGRTSQVGVTMGGQPGTTTMSSVPDPVWSPDGSLVAFSRPGRGGFLRGRPKITVAHTDGTAAVTTRACSFSCSVYDITWSPDGYKLAWIEVGGHGRTAIRVEDVSGGSPTTICQNGTCGTSLAQLAWSPGGTRLAVSNQRLFAEGPQVQQGSIWVVAADGSSRQRLTPGATCGVAPGCTADSSPAWSPDGRSLAFIRTDLQSKSQPTVLIRMDVNGRNKIAIFGCRQAPSCLGAPAWSPDGSAIAVVVGGVGSDPRAVQIDLVDPQNGSLRLIDFLSNTGCLEPSSPVWSPDGKELLVSAHPWQVTNLCVVSPDGVRPIVVAHDVAAGPSPAGLWVHAGVIDPAAGPAPSPAPTVGALVSSLPLPPGRLVFGVQKIPGGDPAGGTYQVRSDGSGFAPYSGPGACASTFSPDGLSAACVGQAGPRNAILVSRPGVPPAVINRASGVYSYVDQPAWSPVGSTIAYVSFTATGGLETYDLRLYDPVSGKDRFLRTGETDPTWSPNGTRIAATRPNNGDTNGRSEIDAISVATGQTTPVLQVTGVVSDLAWSPDGQWIAFRWDTATASGIWLVHPDGTGLRLVPSPTSAGGPYAWSPDSHYLVFGAADSHDRRGLYAARISDGATALLARAQPGVDAVAWVPGSS